MTAIHPVEIRPAVDGDLFTVFRIEKASFPQPWPFEAFETFVGEPGFLVADEGERVIGYVVSDTVLYHGRPVGHVKDLAVHPDRRGEGVGRRLLERALAVLSADGVRRVKLEVRENNERARSLYRSFGFETRRTIPGYYDDGEAARVMVRSLDSGPDAGRET